LLWELRPDINRDRRMRIDSAPPDQPDTFSLVQISDMHLSRERPFFHHNWQVTLDWLNAVRPDLVVCTGDLAFHGAESDDDLAFVGEQLARIAAPVLAVPGNHDTGNTPPDRRGEPVVTPERLARYARRVGPDRWVRDIGAWRLIGLNSQIMGSGLPAEEDQLAALDTALAGADGRRIAIFKHKPLFLRDPRDKTLDQGCVFPEPRAVLMERLRPHAVGLIANGHGHEFLVRHHGATRCVWAPGIGFVARHGRPSRGGGVRRVGLLHYRFTGPRFTLRRIELPGMLDIDIGGWVRGNIGLYLHYATAPFARPAAPPPMRD